MKQGPKYAIFAGAAARDSRLTAGDIRVLAILGTHSDNGGWCHPSQDLIAQSIGVRREAVSRAITKLEKCGYVSVHRNAIRSKNGRPMHRYRVVTDLPDDVASAAALSKYDTCDRERTRADERTCDPVISDQERTCDREISSDVRESAQGTTPGNEGGYVSARAMLDRLIEVAGPGLADPSKEPGLLTTATVINHWIAQGADFERDVVPVVEAETAYAREPQIASWRWFNKPVQRHAAERLALKQIEPAQEVSRDRRPTDAISDADIEQWIVEGSAGGACRPR